MSHALAIFPQQGAARSSTIMIGTGGAQADDRGSEDQTKGRWKSTVASRWKPAALSKGIRLIKMEVGIRNTDGQSLYRSAGYKERRPLRRLQAVTDQPVFRKSDRRKS
ncbi:hypothetical protein [Rhizobium yanglingense]